MWERSAGKGQEGAYFERMIYARHRLSCHASPHVVHKEETTEKGKGSILHYLLKKLI